MSKAWEPASDSVQVRSIVFGDDGVVIHLVDETNVAPQAAMTQEIWVGHQLLQQADYEDLLDTLRAWASVAQAEIRLNRDRR